MVIVKIKYSAWKFNPNIVPEIQWQHKAFMGPPNSGSHSLNVCGGLLLCSRVQGQDTRREGMLPPSESPGGHKVRRQEGGYNSEQNVLREQGLLPEPPRPWLQETTFPKPAVWQMALRNGEWFGNPHEHRFTELVFLFPSIQFTPNMGPACPQVSKCHQARVWGCGMAVGAGWVLAHWGSHHKGPRTGWLTQPKLLSHNSRGCKSEIKTSAGLVSSEHVHGCLLPVSSHGLPSIHVCVLISSCKDTHGINRSTTMTSLLL